MRRNYGGVRHPRPSTESTEQAPDRYDASRKETEFRAVTVMACDDEIIPSQERIENVADDADLEVVYDTERHLLYVGCTRARDHLLVTGVKPASEFLDESPRERTMGLRAEAAQETIRCTRAGMIRHAYYYVTHSDVETRLV